MKAHRGVSLTALMVSAVAVVLLAAGAAAGAQPRSVVLRPAAKPQLAEPNPAFVVWQAMRGLQPVLDAASPHGLGERPGPQPVLTAPAGGSDLPGLLGYAPSFDLRTQSPARLTAVRNQGSYGTCWAFATYGAMESELLPGEADDFSEDNLVLGSGFDSGDTATAKYDFGGNLEMSTAYLSRWAGPVYESDDAYGDGATPAGLSARKHVQDVSWYAPRAGPTDNDRIKYALTTYGAVMASMSWQGSATSSSASYNASTHAYYYDGKAGANHAVVIVGWDDDYAASNFSTAPPGDGAFIVRNSWGSGWGSSGYFYLSYYDSQFARTTDCATFEGVQPAGNYGAIYQYDPLGYTAAIGYAGGTTWMANAFTATAAQGLDAVGFYALAAGTTYEVYAGSSLAGLNKLTTGTLAQAGFHTVTVPAGTRWSAGATFVVAVKVTSPGVLASVALERPIPGYASPTAGLGQSYLSANGISWSDVADAYANTNVCLKAYASSGGPTSSSSYDYADSAASGWKTAAQTVTVTATAGSGAGLTIHTSQNGGVTWNVTAGTSASISVGGQGAHLVKYYAEDSLSTEPVHTGGWVNVDTVAPTTTDDHLSVPLLNGASITLTPADATSGMSGGFARTEYRVDGAATYTTGTTVTLATEGEHTVAYRSTDKAGNVESPDKTFTVTVQAEAAPTSGTTFSGFAADARSGWTTRPQAFTITAAGGSGTGRTIHYTTDGGVTWSTSTEASVDVQVSTQGAHHVEYYASDSLFSESIHDAGWINIDSGTPSTKATRASVRRRARVKLRFRVADPSPGCGKATVKLQIRKRSRVVKTITVGLRATNAGLAYTYRARLKRGLYTWRVLARDIAGNAAVKRTSARLVVR